LRYSEKSELSKYRAEGVGSIKGIEGEATYWILLSKSIVGLTTDWSTGLIEQKAHYSHHL